MHVCAWNWNVLGLRIATASRDGQEIPHAPLKHGWLWGTIPSPTIIGRLCLDVLLGGLFIICLSPKREERGVCVSVN